MITYKYEMSGVGGNGNTWRCEGTVYTENPGDVLNVPALALEDAFHRLTQGRAIYGNPGVGCNGPYRIMRLLLEEQTQ